MSDFKKKLEQLSPEKRALLLKKLQEKGAGKKKEIPPRPDPSVFPLSPEQKRLWFLQQLEPESPFYNVSAILKISGDLDSNALQWAFEQVVNRHQIFKTYFIQENNQIIQKVATTVPVKLQVENVSHYPNSLELLHEKVKQEIAQPFDLSRPPLFRILLYKLEDQVHYLVLVLHHIIFDGWSIPILIGELSNFYLIKKKQIQTPIPELQIQYFDYAYYRTKNLDSPLYAQQLNFWKSYLEGMPSILNLPMDYSRKAVQHFRGQRVYFEIPTPVHQKINEIALQENATPFMVYLAAVQIFLYKLSQQEDFGIGIPINLRNHPQLEKLIGFFVNTLVVRSEIKDRLTFRELLQNVRERVLKIRDNMEVPFDKIVEGLQVDRSAGASPLFNVMYDYQADVVDKLQIGELTIENIEPEIQTAKFDLLITIQNKRGKVFGIFEYDTELFHLESIQYWRKLFLELLTNLTLNPEEKISHISLLPKYEFNKIIHFGKTVEVKLSGRTFPELFEKQVEAHPDRPAVEYADTVLSFKQLNERANKVAHLLHHLGVKIEEIVGVCLPRSVDLIATILGVLKAGGAYVPLDPDYPEKRIEFILEDAKPRVVITNKKLESKFNRFSTKIITIDKEDQLANQPGENLPCPAEPFNLAYIIYTSGSTGKPKGVMIQHHSVINLFEALNERIFSKFKDTPLKASLNAPILFDASVQQLVLLLNGYTLSIIPQEVRKDGKKFLNYIAEHKIDVLDCVPSQLKLLIESGLFHDSNWKPKICLPGGEAIDADLWSLLKTQKSIHFFNMYGPTECTVDSIVCEIHKAADVPVIGTPLANLNVYILDKNLHPVPVGVPGEIYISGKAVARGYWERPELTAERFLPDPFSDTPGTRMYRTGDWGKWRPDGTIEFLGREDNQVKIRGFRIELGEIRFHLNTHPDVSDSAVLVYEKNQSKQIVAFWIPRNPQAEPNFESFLKERLPAYMIPEHFVKTETFPLTPNGKLDSRALLEMFEHQRQTRPYIPPQNPLENYLAALWKEVLNVEHIGVYDDFFELGGDSIKAAILINRIQEEIGKEIPVRAIFLAPTIAEFERYAIENFSDIVEEKFGKIQVANKALKTPIEKERVPLTSERINHFHQIITTRSQPVDLQVKEKNPPAVFVLSPPRSGSTLLRVMLAGNARLFAPPEMDLLSFSTMQERRKALQGHRDLWEEAVLRVIMELLQCDVPCAEKMLREWEEKDLPTQEVYRIIQEWADGRLLVDKTPTYALYPHILKRAEMYFQDPYYIHLTRHPYGTIFSILESKVDQQFIDFHHPFSRSELAELVWLESHRNILQFLNEIPRERVIRLRFEDLVANPRQEMERVCQFLGIEFDPLMLNPYTGNRMTDPVYQFSQMVGDFKFYSYRKIEKNVAFRWHNYLEKDFLASESWQLAESLGYFPDEVQQILAEKQKQSSPQVARVRSLNTIPKLPRTKDKRFSLSFAQQRLWFFEQWNPGSPLYNIPGAVKIKGKLNVDALRESVAQIIARHESLRTSIESEEGQPFVKIHSPFTPEIPVDDLRQLPKHEKEQQLRRIITKEVQTGFQLNQRPLFRMRLIQLENDEFVLCMVFHHIIADGWSIGIFIREMIHLYEAKVADQSPQLPELLMQYVDYAAWQREWFEKGHFKKQLAYWQNQLSDLPELLNLPTDFPRPAVMNNKGKRFAFTISEDVYQAIYDLAQQLRTTPYVILLAAFAILLYRLSGQRLFGIGTPVAGRIRRELEPLIGFFVNTLVMRIDIETHTSFRDFATQLNQILAEALANQEIPFEQLVSELGLERRLDHTPLFQVMFTYQPYNFTKLESNYLQLSPVWTDSETSKFDLTLEIIDRGTHLGAVFEYRTDLFTEKTIQQWSTYFQTLLHGVIQSSQRAVSSYSLLKPEEYTRLLQLGAGPSIRLERGQLAHRVFEEIVEANKNTVALNFLGRELSYAQLNAKANQVAHYLRKMGVGPDVTVGISVDRSLEMIIGILGILKAGGAYVPIDPELPEHRRFYMINQSKITVLLTQNALSEIYSQFKGRLIVLDDWKLFEEESPENLPDNGTEQNLAYIIFTSGSTGQPKGVMIQHKSLVNMALFYIRKLGLNAGHRILQFFSISFDGSVADIFMTLLSGATLYLVPRAILTSGNELHNFIKENGITHMVMTPSLLNALSPHNLPDLQTVVCGGEAFGPELVKKWSQGRAFFNVYGPTEVTVTSSVERIDDIVKKINRVVIGKPLPNYHHYVVDEDFNLVPPGVVGELLIGGSGVARGYIGRPDLTAERFIPDPFSGNPGERLYKTGDMVRLLPDGRLEYVGRKDNQVKIRGFRIELEEIESHLNAHEMVEQAAVLAKPGPGGDKQLVAYVQFKKDTEATIEELKAFLSNRLPNYMVPTRFMVLEKLPLNPSGKIDRRRLPDPDFSRETLKTPFVAPRNEREQKLAEIWKQVLHLDTIGVKDNFFEIGGDSIISIQVIARANQLGFKLTPQLLFENPTIEALAQVAEVREPIKAEQGLVTGAVQLTPIQRWFFEENFEQPHHWNQNLLLKVNQPLVVDVLREAVATIEGHHDALRLRFKHHDGKWQAYISPDHHPQSFEYFSNTISHGDITAELQKRIAFIQQQMHLENGPIFKVAYLNFKSVRYLFISVHHMAIDGLSWRILLEDLQQAYQQLLEKGTVQLFPKTTSIQYWAEKLGAYARERKAEATLRLWEEMLSEPPALPIDNPDGNNLERDATIISRSLSKAETSLITQQVPNEYQIKPKELLLAAFVRAYYQWSDMSELLLIQESHGRPDLFPDVDVSRTVGWFTAMYPVRFKHVPLEAGQLLRSVKSILGGIPNDGIDFGILKYMQEVPTLKAQPLPFITFNYLGQFESAEEQQLFVPVGNVSLMERHPENHRPFELDVSTSVVNGTLQLTILFSKKRWNPEHVQQLMDLFYQQLMELSRYCVQSEDAGYIAADFSDVDLEEDDIEDILDELEDDE